MGYPDLMDLAVGYRRDRSGRRASVRRWRRWRGWRRGVRLYAMGERRSAGPGGGRQGQMGQALAWGLPFTPFDEGVGLFVGIVGNGIDGEGPVEGHETGGDLAGEEVADGHAGFWGAGWLWVNLSAVVDGLGDGAHGNKSPGKVTHPPGRVLMCTGSL